jgi:4-hydroxybenzoate polyprenyltransferase
MIERLTLILESMRPKQWTKNALLFAGILFSQNFLVLSMLTRVLCAFFVFCVLSGAVYLFNDLLDVKRDRSHPVKSQRPLASGRLPVSWAVYALVISLLVSLGMAYGLGLPFFGVAAGYLALQVAYSLHLKHVVILDIFCIAAGFVLRALAGAVVIDVAISSWLIICTILLSLFLGMSKRRHELEMLEDDAQAHRKVLDEYSTYLLDQMIAVVTASTVVCYALYTMSTETIAKFGTRNLVFTVPFVLYGILRYLYLIHKRGQGGNPENILVSDKPLLFNIFLWALTSGVILYR